MNYAQGNNWHPCGVLSYVLKEQNFESRWAGQVNITWWKMIKMAFLIGGIPG